MNIELAYAGTSLRISIPDFIQVDEFSPRHLFPTIGEEVFAERFLRMFGTEMFTGSPSLVVVNDGYRSTPTATILEWLYRLSPLFVLQSHYLVSTGTHPPPTEEHYRKIFGKLWDDVKGRVAYHDARETASMALVGKDRFQKEVWVNKAIVEHDRVLVIGSVEPHYFAGYTGGRKSIFPGVTDFETVVRNHNMANSLAAAPLKLSGNPVAEHLDSLMRMLPAEKFYGIQIVADSRKQIVGLTVGHLEEAFEEAKAIAQEVFVSSVSKQYDVVIGEVLPPLDKNLYQAQKALENSQAAVRDGGKAIIVSACSEGIGSTFFYDLADNWDAEKNQAKDGKRYFGSHKLSRVLSMRKRIGVFLHCSLSPEVIRHVYYEPLDISDFFSYSAKEECEINNVAVVHDAAHTVLKVDTA